MGDKKLDDLKPHSDKLKELLDENEMEKTYSNWITWKNLNPQKEANNLYETFADADGNLGGLFSDWWNTFNKFAENVKEEVEKLNQIIASQTS